MGADVRTDTAADEALAEELSGFLDDVATRVANEVGQVGGVVGVAVTLGGSDGPRTAGASNALVAEVDRVQYSVGVGPCLHALETGAGMYVPDLAGDDRWDDYGRRAAELGVRSCVSVPVLVGGETVGVLKVYAEPVDGLDETQQKAAHTVAAEVAGGIGLARRLTRQATRITDMASAMDNRRTIDLALGILVERRQCGPDEAFALLRQLSQHRNAKLRDVAREVVTSATVEDSGTAPFRQRGVAP